MGYKPLLTTLVIIAVFSGTAAAENPGESLYRKKCANCHGWTGEGNGPDAIQFNFNPKPVNFVNDLKNNPPGRLSKKSDKELANSIRRGLPNTAMGSFKTLSDQEVADLVHYIRSLHKK